MAVQSNGVYLPLKRWNADDALMGRQINSIRQVLAVSEFILVLALLTTESSYKSEVERPATAIVDTAQFWFGPQALWRIRTYAIDHDIHVYTLGARQDGSSLTTADIEAHINKHYADVLGKLYVIQFNDPNNGAKVSKVLQEHGLSGALVLASAGFAFYNPDRGQYKTQSAPK